jgi:DNA sulfur modification protein DndD
MRLERVVLHNFGVYAGRHELDLRPSDDEHPIVLIGALNGGGKTTLLDSIQLALYGKRARCSNRGSHSYDEFLRRCVNRSAAGEGAAVEVEFSTVTAGIERRFRLHRSWSGSAPGSSVRERFEVYVDGFRDKVLEENWNDHVEEILPLEVSQLFFFDGEKIEALADPLLARTVIATSISALLGLGLLDRLQADLTVFERRQKSGATDEVTAGRIDELEAALQVAERERQDAVQHKAAVQTDLERNLHLLAEAERELEREGGALFDQRKMLEEQRRSTKLNLDHVRDRLRDNAAGALPLMLVRPLLERVHERAEREARSAVDAAAVSVFEERDQRVLELAASSPQVRLALEDFLSADRAERAENAQVESVVELGHAGLAQLSLLLGTDFGRLANEVQSLLEEEAAFVQAVDDADRQLAGVPTEDAIAGALDRRAAAQRDVDVAHAKLEVADEEVERATRNRDDHATALAKATEEAALVNLAGEDVERLLEHSSRVRSTMDKFRAALLERSLGKIEAAVLEAFRTLHRKSSLVQDLQIDPVSFDLVLIGPEGVRIPAERLSAGERQLLAIAMLWGLARVAGRDLPMVIDTPLGRLDSEHRRLLVDSYFPYASGQVLLLSTDEEIDEPLLRSLIGSVSHCYTLDYDVATHSTSVQAGYFWPAEVTNDVA